jgi:hypothetical protein
MGYDLYSEEVTDVSVTKDEKYFRWNIFSWAPVLSLANMYGWTPEGTTVPRLTEQMAKDHEIAKEEVQRHNIYAENWDGSYHGNEGQFVSSTDALNIALAIESSLDDIPDFEIPTPGVSEDGTASLKNNPKYDKHREALASGVRSAYIVQYSGIESKKYLRAFIKFLKLGKFSIN